ncbi:MAG: sigma-54-dependent Fis family transcriptional regulator [Deltaproteobacteria bacterium]|nr:sigma-54-dependent Fis family transcriptional regulator [Deltaproteobacteria bacterium]
MGGKILIVDDEKDMLALLKRIVNEDTEYEVTTETSPLQALDLFKNQPFDMVITDLKMPEMDGIQLLEHLKKIGSDVSVVVMTAYGTIETAVEATQKGAYDYITKPFRRERILLTIEKVMEWQTLVKENQALKKALVERDEMSDIIGATPIMEEIFKRVRQVAPTTATVLITGASGTGKELVARAIHYGSRCSARKLVTVNCTAIPENVIESELFGHVRGAFTGAWKDKKGLVEEAHEGTLFLDEIGDLSPLMQTKLLRLLQEGEYKPMGSVNTQKADLRFIAATNHDLKEDIRNKTFREDLYYRLNVLRFKLPTLRERSRDIPLLAHYFLDRYNERNDKKIKSFSPAGMQALMMHEYPGNVRELENIIERGVIYCHKDTLGLRDLSLDSDLSELSSSLEPEISHLSFKEAKEKMLQQFHAWFIQSLLKKSNGNISRAAETAGIQRQYLHRLMKETGIEAEDYKLDR